MDSLEISAEFEQLKAALKSSLNAENFPNAKSEYERPDFFSSEQVQELYDIIDKNEGFEFLTKLKALTNGLAERKNLLRNWNTQPHN